MRPRSSCRPAAIRWWRNMAQRPIPAPSRRTPMRCTPLSWSSSSRLPVAACFGLALALMLARPAAAQSSAVVILDHSSSMWQTVGGAAKAVVARDMLKTLIEEHEGKLDLGLMLFGAKKSGGCDDMDALKPI